MDLIISNINKSSLAPLHKLDILLMLQMIVQKEICKNHYLVLNVRLGNRYLFKVMSMLYASSGGSIQLDIIKNQDNSFSHFDTRN